MANFVTDALGGVISAADYPEGGEGRIFEISGVTSVDETPDNLVPTVCQLEQNFPNPFNPNTEIRFSLPAQSQAKLVIYDLLGRELMSLVDEVKSAGFHSVTFDASQLSSGAYFYRLQSKDFVQIRKKLLTK